MCLCQKCIKSEHMQGKLACDQFACGNRSLAMRRDATWNVVFSHGGLDAPGLRTFDLKTKEGSTQTKAKYYSRNLYIERLRPGTHGLREGSLLFALALIDKVRDCIKFASCPFS